MDIGAIIVKQREEQKLSQRALAQKAGIRQATLTSIERGGEVKLTTADSILSALGLSLEVTPLGGDADASEQRQAEIKRVQAIVKQRRSKLQALLGELSLRQIRHVREINRKTNTGYLAELWNEFLQLDQSTMQKALDAERFKGMAWQSLLQANPFIVAGVGSWA
ncbi:MAG: helix-turn-helix transcriptional regulator [Rhodocyclaceae bacterium]|nr:helix-turn-helix transcriptional regulator [Rhodocyclaceae bacterium]